MEEWIELYHQIYIYTVEDNGNEWIHKDYSVEFDSDFVVKTAELEALLEEFPDPYGDDLPTYYHNFSENFE